jgi:DinB superfamily
MRTEQHTLKELTKETHHLVLYYLKHLKDTDVSRVISIDGIELNSVHWIAAHLCSIADMLFYAATGSENPDKPSWLSQYGLGSNPKHVTDIPPFDSVVEYLNQIYHRAYDLIEQMPEEKLDQENLCNLSFGGDRTIRKVLYHQIRHEASHAGNLAWLCKLNGIKTI